MYYRRTFRRKPRYTYHEGTAGQHSAPPRKPRRAGGISLILFLCSILIFLACALAFSEGSVHTDRGLRRK